MSPHNKLVIVRWGLLFAGIVTVSLVAAVLRFWLFGINCG